MHSLEPFQNKKANLGKRFASTRKRKEKKKRAKKGAKTRRYWLRKKERNEMNAYQKTLNHEWITNIDDKNLLPPFFHYKGGSLFETVAVDNLDENMKRIQTILEMDTDFTSRVFQNIKNVIRNDEFYKLNVDYYLKEAVYYILMLVIRDKLYNYIGPIRKILESESEIRDLLYLHGYDEENEDIVYPIFRPDIYDKKRGILTFENLNFEITFQNEGYGLLSSNDVLFVEIYKNNNNNLVCVPNFVLNAKKNDVTENNTIFEQKEGIQTCEIEVLEGDVIVIVVIKITKNMETNQFEKVPIIVFRKIIDENIENVKTDDFEIIFLNKNYFQDSAIPENTENQENTAIPENPANPAIQENIEPLSPSVSSNSTASLGLSMALSGLNSEEKGEEEEKSNIIDLSEIKLKRNPIEGELDVFSNHDLFKDDSLPVTFFDTSDEYDAYNFM
jgi:hypothetical protein